MTESGAAVEMRAALLRLRRAGGVPVAFGGLFAGTRQFRISELVGTTTAALQGLAITTGNGLGGKAATLCRPLCVPDYPVSRVISHEYDTAVAAEGLRAMLAVPVVVRRRVRGVLYGAVRQPMPLGDRALASAVEAARELEQSLAVREEARRLLAVARGPFDTDPAADPAAGRQADRAAAWEEVRAVHGELRALAQRIPDAALRGELLSACARLARAAAPAAHPAAGAREEPGGPRVTLSPRELDVLACVASGETNAGAAERLGLRPETVKSYLRAAMRKLGAHTRLQAVVEARRAGLLP
ncbi:LuxR C-terminal-related transcriptional regulator [Streptomyces sp. LX-29]|uniref:helix-turn-helix transcriptional regulator n=1 Tax=Streptomyces sp. LX-29 TaxID=2900152 RepID=UPI00240E6CE1|nr:LuxR family transcriptional regulator [Streptomyces sp. LX-29]WFB06855.1 LuxR C-terminal-related transcriptional regulator [Streptomyces sp. LX-29]